MHRPLELLHENVTNVVKIIEVYEQDIDDFKEHLRLKGKNIVVANNEQPSWLVFYDSRRSELKSSLDYMEVHVQKVRGKLWKDYTENYSRDLQAKDKEQYINHEPSFLNAYELYLELKDLYDRYVAIVDAFKARGYALNNITRLVTSETSDYMIE
jgi:hypothetical protein